MAKIFYVRLFMLVALLLTVLHFSPLAMAKKLSGSRGYIQVDKEKCSSNYTISNARFKDGEITFWSEKRKWTWRANPGSLIYFLVETKPKTDYATTGELVQQGKEFNGWLVNGLCGKGWVKLKVKS